MIAKALRILAPNGKFVVGSNYDSINWIDEHITGVSKPTEKDVNDKIAELKALEPMRLLRLERNRRLSETDWMANSDVVMTDGWKIYRQALRDLPATQIPMLNEQGILTNITWPEEPA
tara:strand:+ start:308 stop:661 length:354 start_codon:yes stop_codon:yes gene_type:complete